MHATHEALPAVASGALAFAGAATISQALQLPLGISTGSQLLGVRVLPSLLGAATVGFASCAALAATEAALNVPTRRREVSLSGAALFGAATFALLGGRFWALSPSSLTSLGAFAEVRGSISATLAYATRTERATIQKFGRQFGCHTCGERFLLSSGRFIADHVPPLYEAQRANRALWRRLLSQPVTQRFYPQCTACSSRQAVLLAERARLAAKEARPPAGMRTGAPSAIFHPHSLLRPYNAVGGILAALEVSARSAAGEGQWGEGGSSQAPVHTTAVALPDVLAATSRGADAAAEVAREAWVWAADAVRRAGEALAARDSR